MGLAKRKVSEQAMVDGRRYSDEGMAPFKRTLLGLVDLPGGAKAGESTTKLNVSSLPVRDQSHRLRCNRLGVIFEG